MTQETPPSISASDHSAVATDQGVAISGQDIVAITGDVGGDVIITMGVPELRRQELDYLADIIRRRQSYAQKYTPMSGVAEVTKEIVSDPLPSVLVPPEFMLLRKRGGGMQAEVERVPVSDLREAIRQNRRMVLLGEPGSGKTTTLWDLAYHHALEAQKSADAPLPIFVPLGGYTGPEPALEYVKAQAGALGPHLTPLLQDGRAMLLLDALNEMPSVGYHERVRRVQTLLSEFRDAPAVVTCRALDYVETLDLHKLEIQPLGPLRQRAFVENYLGPEQGDALFWQMAGTDVADAWQVWRKVGGAFEAFWTAKTVPEGFSSWRYGQQRHIWERLRNDELPPLLALGRNPYMLFMMVQVYLTRDGVLAGNRGQLFSDFSSILMERERHRVAPSLWPGDTVFRQALVALAFAMQVAGERGTAIDPDWVKQQMAVDDQDAAGLLHLARRASLLDLEGSKVRFVHQLVQEYFAAVALGERLAAGEDLQRYWPEGWVDPSGWEETAVLLAGLLPDMTPLVRHLLVANPPLAARCIAESGGERPAEDMVRTVRQQLVDLMTGPQAAIPQRKKAGVAINYVGDPRRGVGLRSDGLPDIDWVFVPKKDPGRGDFVFGERNKRRPEPDFWIAHYPITCIQYQAFLDAPDGFRNPRCWQGLAAPKVGWSSAVDKGVKLWNHPCESVRWYDAIAFGRWLTATAKEHHDLLPHELDRNSNWRITLPTEWQWEKAARGHDGRDNPSNDVHTWDRTNAIDNSAQVDAYGSNQLSAVGMYLHTQLGDLPHGISDLGSNLWEWCLNEYKRSEDGHDEGSDWRVWRGESWDFNRAVAAAPFRYLPPDYINRALGFRVCAVIRQE